MVKIRINSIEHCLNTSLTFAEYKEIVDILNKDAIDYKEFFVEFISKKILADDGVEITVDYIDKYCDLSSLLDVFISNDEKLKVLYEHYLLEMDMYKAFFSAIHQKLDNEWKETANKIPQIETQILSVVSSFGRKLAKAVTSSTIEALGKVVTQFYESIGELSIKVAKMVREIKIPTISDGRKEELATAFKTWGSYGWTILPNAPIFYYEDVYEDIKTAHKAAMIYCKKNDIESLFSDLCEMKGIKKSDVEEAIFDFDHGQYKSCALILFALIDAKLIRLQSTKKQRKVGKGAVDLLMKKTEAKTDIEQMFILLLYYENLIACLLKMFEKANDFRKQPDVINRNFIDHGMMTRKVLKRDCIQLFLLYYNLLMFLDFNS